MKNKIVLTLSVFGLALVVGSMMSGSAMASRNEKRTKPTPTATPKPTVTPKVSPTPTVAPAPITAPYNQATDLCQGYRYFGGVALANGGVSVSPACYNAAQLSPTIAGTPNLIPTFVPVAGVQYYFVW